MNNQIILFILFSVVSCNEQNKPGNITNELSFTFYENNAFKVKMPKNWKTQVGLDNRSVVFLDTICCDFDNITISENHLENSNISLEDLNKITNDKLKDIVDSFNVLSIQKFEEGSKAVLKVNQELFTNNNKIIQENIYLKNNDKLFNITYTISGKYTLEKKKLFEVIKDSFNPK